MVSIQVYKELYPHHESLRQSLTTAYVDIITICTRYRSFIREQKSTSFGRLRLPLTPRSTKNFKSSIDTFKNHEKNVRMQVDICSKIEAKKTSEMIQANREREIKKIEGMLRMSKVDTH